MRAINPITNSQCKPTIEIRLSRIKYQGPTLIIRKGDNGIILIQRKEDLTSVPRDLSKRWKKSPLSLIKAKFTELSLSEEEISTLLSYATQLLDY